MADRTIIIGDVHGCWDELRDLLSEIRPGPQDKLISVGDLICKGPDSESVLDWAMSAKNLQVVLGNHELRFLTRWKSGLPQDEKPYDMETFRQLEGGYERYMRFIDAWPLYISHKDYLVVHAGFDPLEPLVRQSRRQLTNLRRCGDSDRPWFEGYVDSRLVVFGHWAHRKPIVRANAIGLDTGCVYGEALSALVLPERRIVSVKARKAYRIKEEWKESSAESAWAR